jgi:hypothetical protein
LTLSVSALFVRRFNRNQRIAPQAGRCAASQPRGKPRHNAGQGQQHDVMSQQVVVIYQSGWPP